MLRANVWTSLNAINWLDWMYWGPGGISAADFYCRIYAIMHLTGGSGENWPRTILEAWAFGVIPIVDADYGVVEMVSHGIDGFHARSPDEAAYFASIIAFDSGLQKNGEGRSCNINP